MAENTVELIPPFMNVRVTPDEILVQLYPAEITTRRDFAKANPGADIEKLLVNSPLYRACDLASMDRWGSIINAQTASLAESAEATISQRATTALLSRNYPKRHTHEIVTALQPHCKHAESREALAAYMKTGSTGTGIHETIATLPEFQSPEGAAILFRKIRMLAPDEAFREAANAFMAEYHISVRTMKREGNLLTIDDKGGICIDQMRLQVELEQLVLDRIRAPLHITFTTCVPWCPLCRTA